MAEVEAGDRTQSPSKLRRQQARERGQVAHSTELTGAVALLAAALLIGVVGEPLGEGLLSLVRGTWTGELPVTLDLADSIEQLRHAAWNVLGPLVLLILGTVAAGLAAHQAQAGGLWVPGLLAPDVGRLWGTGGGEGFAGRAGRGLWSIAKGLIVLVVAAWAIRMRVDSLTRLDGLEASAIARTWAEALRSLLVTMAAATLALGLVDYALRHRRVESMLRMTPEQSREDQKAMDGDPALRSRRRRLARAWHGDAPELLAGATLAVAGPKGLIVILVGGPPPKGVSVRSAADGATGARLRRAVESAPIPLVEQGDLARKLARLASKPNQKLTTDLNADLEAVWPARSGGSSG
jgi:flagellar biosynthetic protein FlhB